MVANMSKYDNNQLPFRTVSMHTVITRIEGNEITKTARKGRILAAASTVKLEPWPAKNEVRKMHRLRTVDGATLDSKYANIICLLLCVS